jgi:hypothetical protein
MPQQLVVAARAPFGVSAVRRRTGVRLNIETKGNREGLYADLSAAAAEHLRDQLSAALAADGAGVD